MKIKLNIDGKDKTFDTGPQTAAAIFKAAEFEEEFYSEKSSLKRLNLLADQVVAMYGNQFTAEDLKNGLSAEEFREVMNYQCFGIGQKIAEKSTKND